MAVATRRANAPKAAAANTSRNLKTPSRSTASRSKASSRASQRAAAILQPITQVNKIPSASTVSPDIIQQTDVEAPNNQDLLRQLIQGELAETRGDGAAQEDNYYIQKLHTQRRRRYRRHYSSDFSSDSEVGDGPRLIRVLKPRIAASKSSAATYRVCKQLNKGKCVRDHCWFSHIRLIYQQTHPANAFPRPLQLLVFTQIRTALGSELGYHSSPRLKCRYLISLSRQTTHKTASMNAACRSTSHNKVYCLLKCSGRLYIPLFHFTSSPFFNLSAPRADFIYLYIYTHNISTNRLPLPSSTNLPHISYTPAAHSHPPCTPPLNLPHTKERTQSTNTRIPRDTNRKFPIPSIPICTSFSRTTYSQLTTVLLLGITSTNQRKRLPP